MHLNIKKKKKTKKGRSNRHFCKEDTHSQKCMKGCSTLLIVKEIQIRTTRRCHFTLLRMAVIKSSTNGFPGDSLVKNMPANAGDTGSIPDHGRFHMLWNN